MIEPALAPVPPHVISPLTKESVRLDEIIPERIESMPRGAILILGGPGSGKTTALCHLAAVLRDREDVVLLDEPTAKQARRAAEDHVVILAHDESPFPMLNLPLVPWTRDDVIAYLLAVHPEQCSSVMKRLSMADSLLMDGTPLMWRIVLDRLAQNSDLDTARSALHEYWSESLTGKKVRATVCHFSLASLFKQRREAERNHRWLKRSAVTNCWGCCGWRACRLNSQRSRSLTTCATPAGWTFWNISGHRGLLRPLPACYGRAIRRWNGWRDFWRVARRRIAIGSRWRPASSSRYTRTGCRTHAAISRHLPALTWPGSRGRLPNWKSRGWTRLIFRKQF